MGEVEDDTGIDRIEVSLNNTDVWSPVTTLDPDSGKWTYVYDTTGDLDGPIKLRFRVYDRSGKFVETDSLPFTIKNQPPQIKLTIPDITEAGFDNAGLNSMLGGEGYHIPLVNDLMGLATDSLGIAKGYPQIMFWPADYSNVDGRGIPPAEDLKYGVWRTMGTPKPEADGLLATQFNWPLVELVPDGQGGWTLPNFSSGAVAFYAPGNYRFRIRTMDKGGTINTYPNRIDNSLGLSPEAHPNQYIQVHLIATTNPVITILNKPEKGWPFPAYYNGSKPLEIYIAAIAANPISKVRGKIGNGDFSSGGYLATPLDVWEGTAGRVYKLSIPASDFSGITGGMQILYVEAVDDTDRSTTTSRDFVIDRGKPDLEVNEPSRVPGEAGAWLTSTVNFRGITLDYETSVKELYYALGKNECAAVDSQGENWAGWHDTGLGPDKTPADNTGTSIRSKWSGSLYSWTWNFTDINDVTAPANRDACVSVFGNPAENLWNLPIRFMVKDAADNVTIKSWNVIVDPDADAPRAVINSHAENQIVGGEVRVSGTAADNEWVYGVEVRIRRQPDGQINQGGSNPSSWDFVTGSPASEFWENADIIGTNGSTVSWFKILNLSGDLDPPEGQQRKVQVEVRASDAYLDSPGSFKHYGHPTAMTLNFDSTVPTIKNVEIVRGSIREDYTVGHMVKDAFIIQAKLRDDGGITSIKWRGEETGAYSNSILENNTPNTVNPWVDLPPFKNAGQTIAANKRYLVKTGNTADYTAVGGPNMGQTPRPKPWFVASVPGTAPAGWELYESTTVSSGGSNVELFEYTLNIPRDTNTAAFYGGRFNNRSGSYNLDIQVQDNTEPMPYMAQATLSMQVDNFFPLGSYTGNPNVLGNAFSISGKAWDTGTGISVQGVRRVVVYFSRNNAGVSLWEQNSAGHNPVWINTQEAKTGRIGTETNVSAEGNLGILPFFPDVRQSDGSYKSTDSGIVINDNGLITGINGNNYTQTFTGNPTKTWAVSFNTTNLRDGPVTLHYVIFDTAENATHYTKDIYIGNNRPYIMKFNLGTDIDGNGTVSPWSSESNPGEHLGDYFTVSNTPGGNREITTNFTVRNSRFNIMLDTLYGNVPKYYKVSYVTRGVAVPSTALVRGKVYTINNPGNTDWPSYGALNNSAGTTFVALGAADPGQAEAGTVWGYTEVYSKTAAIGDGVHINNNILFGSGDFGLIPDSIAPGIPGSVVNGEIFLQHSRQFIIKVYDSTVSGAPENDQLAHAVLFNVDIDNTDDTPPKVLINPFHWNSLTDNSLYDNNKEYGHIELEADLPGAFNGGSGITDRDPKVSGQISVRGTVFDNNSIGKVYFKLDGLTTGGTGGSGPALGYTEAAVCNNGTWTAVNSYWTSNGWKFTVDEVYHDQRGHLINWRLDLDTRRISGVAALDRVLSMLAGDITPNYSTPGTVQTTNAAKTSYYRMDVVPYISEIVTEDRTGGGLKANNIRSASGRYSVIQGSNNSFITVKGFNLDPNNSSTNVRLSNDPGSPGVPAAGINLAPTGTAADYSSFKMTNNSNKSGYLTVSTNGIWTLNNVNKNDSQGSYVLTNAADGRDQENMPNRDADRYITKNIILTDDCYLQFFTVKKTDVRNGYNPVMIMNGDNPVFGYVDLTGGPSSAPPAGAGTYMSTHAMPQRGEFTLAGTTVYKEYLIKASIWDGMGMARDDSGRYIHATTYNRDGAAFHLIYDRYAALHGGAQGLGWGSGTTYTGYENQSGHSMANEANINGIALETVNFNSLLLDRYQYPKLIARGNSRTDAAAPYYMTYFDNGTGQLIFRNFQIGTSPSGTPYSLSTTGADRAGYNYNGVKTNLQKNTDVGGSAADAGRLLVASGASHHFDMAVSSDNRVVVAYYDETAGKLALKYSSAPVTGANPTAAITWTNSPAMANMPMYTGSYVSMTMDAVNGLHIAAFDASDSVLKYIYVPNYTQANVSAVTVDQYGSVGHWTDIKLHPTSGVPYIGYYNATETGGREAIKLAYAKNYSTANVKPGVSAGGYTTGDWEYMTVPALDPPQGGSLKFQKVNLGFTIAGKPVLGYLGTYIEFSYPVDE